MKSPCSHRKCNVSLSTTCCSTATTPRLPERLHGGSQSEILDFLHRQGALEELAQSYLDNGFFVHEP